MVDNKNGQIKILTDRQTVSFCLPIYNVGFWVEDCIKSILNQKLPDDCYEIICIDDVSTDDSFDIMKNLAIKYPQIKVYQNSMNRGVAFTRNQCILKAKMDYVWFCDPDDLLLPETVNHFLQKAYQNDADVLVGNYMRVNEEMCVEELSESINYEDESLVELKDNIPIDTNGIRMNAVWCGLFRRKFLLENRIFFREGMIAQEDTLFYYEFSQKNGRFFKWNQLCYAYRMRSTSVMHTKSVQKNKDYYYSMKIMMDVYQHYLNNNLYRDKKVLETKIHHMKENCAFCLAMIVDSKFVKEEYKVLRKKRYYPYRFRKDALYGKRNTILKINTFLLPIPLVFWCSHYMGKILQLNIQKMK